MLPFSINLEVPYVFFAAMITFYCVLKTFNFEYIEFNAGEGACGALLKLYSFDFHYFLLLWKIKWKSKVVAWFFAEFYAHRWYVLHDTDITGSDLTQPCEILWLSLQILISPQKPWHDPEMLRRFRIRSQIYSNCPEYLVWAKPVF